MSTSEGLKSDLHVWGWDILNISPICSRKLTKTKLYQSCLTVSSLNLDHTSCFRTENVHLYGKLSAWVLCGFILSNDMINNEAALLVTHWNWELHSLPLSYAPSTDQETLVASSQTRRSGFDRAALIRPWNVPPSEIPHWPADRWEVLARRQPVQVLVREQQ